MTLNWSTLVLEIINFLVLIWLLQRFLYRPVQQLLERRQAEIQRTLIEAEQRQQQAEKLHLQYQNQHSAWQKQQHQSKAELNIALENQRKTALEQLQQQLQAAREKELAVITRQREQQQQHDQQLALSNGCRFAGQLLRYCSGPDLEQRLIELLIQELRSAPDELCQALRRESVLDIKVETTQELSPSQLETLSQLLNRLLQSEVKVTTVVNQELIAGIRITLGGRILGANIADELQAFAEITPHRNLDHVR